VEELRFASVTSATDVWPRSAEGHLVFLCSRGGCMPDPKRDNAHGPQRLRKREREILQLLTKGLSNKEIAATLGIQEQTVKNAISVLCEKFHARNRIQLAVLAVQWLRKAGRTSQND
jgi:DNA-binding NarL/FixJ family response regulator